MSSTAQELLQQARRFQREGRLDVALATCQQLTEIGSGSPEAWNERGMVELKLERFADAQRSWTESIRLAPGRAAYHHNLGSAYRKQNEWDSACAAYQRAVDLAPHSVESRMWLAECLQRLRRWPEAERHYRQVAVDSPGSARAWVGLGVMLHLQNRESEAIEAFDRARALAPQRPEIYLNLGTSLRALGRLRDAIEPLREAIRLRPDYGKAHCVLGIVHAMRDEWLEALAELTLAVRCQPDNAEAHDEQGKALARFERLDEAIAAHREALRIQPKYVNAWVNLGVLFVESGRHDEARDCLEQARELRPDLPEAHNNLGIAYKGLGRLTEAEVCYRRAIELRPNYAKAHYNLGNVFLEWGRWDEALASFQRAIDGVPDYAEPRFERGVVHLTQGRFEEGWDDYESRWDMRNGRKNRRQFAAPAWRGEPLDGRTLLIYTEQGFGDTFQFIRYAPLAKERGARRVVVECQPRLIPLLRSVAGIDELTPRGSPLPPFDCHAALLSMPRLFGTRLDSIPAATPYLAADAALQERWRARLREWPGFRVGIAWQGSPTYLRDTARSIPLRCFAPLAEVPGVRLVSLQQGAGVEQLRELAGRFPVIELGDDVDTTAGGFMDTAAIVKNLDLVISPDTSLVHLCGALGAACWLALPLAPDWRWLLERSDSPWYPTVKLLRQRQPGDWDELFLRIAASLARSERAP